MNVRDHLKRFPNARPSTLSYIESKEAMTRRLEAENMAEILGLMRQRPKPTLGQKIRQFFRVR